MLVSATIVADARAQASSMGLKTISDLKFSHPEVQDLIAKFLENIKLSPNLYNPQLQVNLKFHFLCVNDANQLCIIPQPIAPGRPIDTYHPLHQYCVGLCRQRN